MRTDQEMMELILGAATGDPRIRAVVMNGSRAVPSAPRDEYQDYDIVYFVRDLGFFIDHPEWIDRFGERIMLEMPSYKDMDPSDYEGTFNYQMLFIDGNRIDLTFASTDVMESVVRNDPVGIVLLDKDGLLDGMVFSGEEAYHVTPPDKKAFEDTCNSFWWVLQNVAKGIARRELPYAIRMLGFARDSLDRVAAWHIGMENGFRVSPGKMGKYFERYMDVTHWRQYVSTYPAGDYESLWGSLFASCALFREMAIGIAERFTYEYPFQDDDRMTDYLKRVRSACRS